MLYINQFNFWVIPVEIYLDECLLIKLVDLFGIYYEASLIQEIITFIINESAEDPEELDDDYQWNYHTFKVKLKQRRWTRVFLFVILLLLLLLLFIHRCLLNHLSFLH